MNLVSSPPIANASYTIDDQEQITFPVESLSNLLFNQLLFKTGQLSPGQHKLVVTYIGNNSNSQPLQFNYLVQQDVPSSITSSNTPTTSDTTTSTSVPWNSLPVSNSLPGKPTNAIIGGVIGGIVFILLLALFFLRRRNERRSYTPNVTHPFTTSPTTLTSQSYTSDGQSLSSPSYSISSKFTHTTQPSPTSPRLPFPGSQTYRGATKTISSQTTTESSIQPSPTSPGTNARFLRHEDSGVRIARAGDDVVELPPFYTPG